MNLNIKFEMIVAESIATPDQHIIIISMYINGTPQDIMYKIPNDSASLEVESLTQLAQSFFNSLKV